MGKNKDSDYKLFETNDVAKYGFVYATGETLTPLSQKTVLFLIWKCILNTPGKFESVTTTIDEICNVLGYVKDKNRNFSRRKKQVEDALMQLMSNPIMLHDATHELDISFSWINKIIVNNTDGAVEVFFDKDLDKLFGPSLVNNFTVIKLKYLNRLRTSSSITLYSYCASLINFKERVVPIEDIYTLFGQTPGDYKHFKGNIILPAIKALNDLTDINVEIRERKEKGRVTAIGFLAKYDHEIDLKDKIREENKKENAA